MKRILGIMLACFLLIFNMSFAAAETETVITLPNGLQFGMTFAEAAAVSGFSNGDRSPIHDAKMNAMGFDNDYLIGKATIGGFDAHLEVCFDHDYLRQIRYCFVDVMRTGKETEDDAEVVSSWKSVGNALKDVYGPSQTTTHQFKNTSVEYSFGSGSDQREESDRAVSKEGYIAKVEGGTVFIDNYIVSRRNVADTGSALDMADAYYFQDHYLLYTFYDFQLDNTEEKSNSVGF